METSSFGNLDKRFRPAGSGLEEAPPPAGRRRRAGLARSRTSLLLVTTLLLAAVVLAVHISPTHQSLAGRRPQRQRQRQLQAPAMGGTADGSLFAERTATTAAGGAAAAGGGAAGAAAEDGDDGSSDGSGGQQQQQQQETSAERTLSFDVCNGFANQRTALLSGMVLAAELNRTMVLPRLLLDGTQPSSAARSIEFGDVFDRAAFTAATAKLGLRIAAEAPPSSEGSSMMDFSRQYNYMGALRDEYRAVQHLRLGCPSFRVPADVMVKHEHLVFAALGALKPVPRLMGLVERIEQHLQERTESSGFNALHINAGEDWAAHCERWFRLTSGLARDNCANNTATVGDALELHRIDHKVPLLVAVSGAGVGDEVVRQALESLRNRKFNVVLEEDVLAGVAGTSSLQREDAALVKYYLALRCRQFIGNSVSVSSALLIMERWHAGSFAIYYNGGNIPLELFMPLFPMPWVFTYNDWSAGTEYDQMVKGAVTSAIQAARMKPFCMFSGSEGSAMYQWLVEQGVTIIRHTPKWKDALIKEGRRFRDLYTRIVSHLYKSDGSILGAFQRVDIPILRELDQYNYVLFTDCDVFFRKHMKLVDWGTPLPSALGLGYERYDLFPYNDGVMLWNMPYMVKTNKKFVSWMLSNKNGMYFPGYGPVDQGAFNQYYEKEVRGKPISKNFNAMIYHTFRPEARVVHLHGPKPPHYLEYLRTGKCQFKDMCDLGLNEGGVCMYFTEYKDFVPDWEQVQTLARLCGNLRAGVWHPDDVQ